MMNEATMFWMMAGTSLISVIYPWDPKWPYAKSLVHLPWLLLPMWWAYESLMPREMNIRMDLLLIVPVLTTVFVIYAVRLFSFFVWLPKSRRG